jgi:hypothetical protein
VSYDRKGLTRLRTTVRLVLAAVPANLLRVLTLVGLDQVFTLRPDSSAAS